ncbi:DUF1772 domain-containing protein [Nocardioides sp. NPDC126508]
MGWGSGEPHPATHATRGRRHQQSTEVAAFAVTIAVHLPLNHALKAARSPDRISDLAQVREAFDEAKWVRWNVVRTIATTAAFGCLAWSLVVQGRLSA